MDAASLNKIASRSQSVADHMAFLLKIAKPCVEIELVDNAPTEDGSRFGGDPFVPLEFQWPTCKVGEYRFLGQFNFSEIANAPDSLPTWGLLSLFYSWDKDGEVFWGDDGFIRGFYWDNLHRHRTMNSPTENMPETQRIKLSAGLSVPQNFELRDDWPFNELALSNLSEDIAAPGEYLLGYPTFASLAYDPTPSPEWISLLTVRSLDRFDWCWHDGDKLMIFIEAAKLAKKDFSHLKCDAG